MSEKIEKHIQGTRKKQHYSWVTSFFILVTSTPKAFFYIINSLN